MFIAYRKRMLIQCVDSLYQLDLIYKGMFAIRNGKVPEYPVRWNERSYLYEVYNIETNNWVSAHGSNKIFDFGY